MLLPPVGSQYGNLGILFLIQQETVIHTHSQEYLAKEKKDQEKKRAPKHVCPTYHLDQEARYRLRRGFPQVVCPAEPSALPYPTLFPCSSVFRVDARLVAPTTKNGFTDDKLIRRRYQLV